MPQYHLNSAVTSFYSWFNFHRNVATIDPQGQSISADKPRFRNNRAIGGVWGVPIAVNDDHLGSASDTEYTIFAAGRALDNASAIIVALKAPASGAPMLKIVVQSGSSFTVSSRELKHVQASSTDPVSAAYDIRPSASTIISDTSVYEPVVGTVLLGTIVILCRVHVFVQGVWMQAGIALYYTVDTGATFVKAFEDISDIQQINKNRVRSWCLQGWFAPWHNLAGSTPPAEAVICFSDYRYAPGTNDQALPQGGRVVFMKFKRASSTAPYLPVLDTGGNARAGVFEVNANAFLDSTHQYIPPGGSSMIDQVNYTHIHSCGITEWGTSENPGWQLIIAIGDVVSSSMIRIIIKKTDDDNFWDPGSSTDPNWIIQRNYHGYIDKAVMDSAGTTGTGTVRAADSNAGNQFVGCGPGPSPGTLLLGQDTIGESLFIFTPAGDTSLAKTFQTTAAPFCSAFTPSNMFHIRTDAPHKALRNVICDDFHSNTIAGYINFPQVDAIGYSPQSGAAGTWTHLPLGFPNAGDSKPWCYKQDSCFVVGDYIYMVAKQSTAAHYPGDSFDQRIVRRKLPAVRTGQELLQIGPGGKQYAVNNPFTHYQLASPAPHERQASRNTNGTFNTVPIPSGTAAVMPVQPPVMVNAVYRFARPRTLEPISAESYSTQYCYLNPTHSGTLGTPFTPRAQRRVALRLWFLNASNADDSPQRTDGRSEASQTMIMQVEGGNPASVPVGIFLSTTDWYCITTMCLLTCGHDNTNGSSYEELVIKPSHAFRETLVGSTHVGVYDKQLLQDSDCYFAVSELLEITDAGNEHFGYPLPPSTTSSGQTFEPERADIELTTTLPGTSSFTLYLAGMTPEDSWEHPPELSSAVPTSAIYPLATLMTASESGASITISAEPYHNPPRLRFDIAWGSSSATYYSNAATPPDEFPLLFARGRTVLFAICYNASNYSIRFHASVGGVRVPVIFTPTTVTVNLSSHTFTRVRFGNKASGTDRVVGAFQWCCVTADGGFTSDSAVDTAFNTLSFIPEMDPFPD